MFALTALVLCLSVAAPPLQAPTLEELAFAKLKARAGTWSGTEQDGRKIILNFEVIANQSVVMATSFFEAHPGEKMVTMYHLDQGKLLLTHYCVAKNQPRLQAKKISEDGSKIEFEFLDGTNLKNQDQGHMDSVIVDLQSTDQYVEQWTWYANGKSSWMEKFTCRRDSASAPAASAKPGHADSPCPCEKLEKKLL